MTLNEIIEIVNGRIFTHRVNLDIEVSSGGASDLMSDVLAFVKPGCLLLTGLIHPQTIRTAEMAEVAAIAFVRGKIPIQETIDLAEELGIPLIGSLYGMYEICGRLYQKGLKPTMKDDD